MCSSFRGAVRCLRMSELPAPFCLAKHRFVPGLHCQPLILGDRLGRNRENSATVTLVSLASPLGLVARLFRLPLDETQPGPRCVYSADLEVYQTCSEPGFTHDALSEISDEARCALGPGDPEAANFREQRDALDSVLEILARLDEPDRQVAIPFPLPAELCVFFELTQGRFELWRRVDKRNDGASFDTELPWKRRSGIAR